MNITKELKTSLYEYITEAKNNIIPDWDGHVHLFNHKKPIPRNHEFELCVGFMDIEYNDLKNINVLDAYTDYIKNHWEKEREILLATGITIEDIKSVFEKYPKIIKGFGELKCYDMYGNEKIPYKKIKLVKDVLKLSNESGCLPVYVHWELNTPKDVERIKNALKSYPRVPLVLCHAGMNETNRDFAYAEARRLQNLYNNLWLDISWDAADYFSNNPMLLNALILDRIILGTDLNNLAFGKNGIHKDRDWKWGLNKYNELKNYLHISNKLKIQKLFSTNF